MELALNLSWVALAAAAYLFVPRRSGRVTVAIGIALALLFPIISPTDDVNATPNFSDAAATLVLAIELAVAFVTFGRLRGSGLQAYAVHIASPSDPRSPPAR